MKKIRVELNMHDYLSCRSESMAQFLVRMKLQSAGIPLGPWGTSRPNKGVLEWYDDKTNLGVRVVTWTDTSPD